MNVLRSLRGRTSTTPWRAPHRRARRGSLLAALAALAAVLVVPWPASAAEVLGDRDARRGSVASTAKQQRIVASMGASATWNDFGQPASLVKYGGYLATGLTGRDAAAVARSWVNANKALFRLGSSGGLKLATDTRLPQSNGYAVLFQQEFGGLRAAEDGMLIVGVVGTPASGWKIAYASSSLTADVALAGTKRLSAQEAWLKAAANIGRAVSAVNVRRGKTDGAWTVFGVNGIAELQRARLVALPTPTDGVRAAWETLFIDNNPLNVTSYQHYVDAETGEVLVRKNLVEHSHPPAATFSGAVPTTDGACDSDKGPWVISSGENVGSIVVSVEAHMTTNDSVIHLLRNGGIVASQDTLFSPEVIVYAPDGGVPPGSYTVRVCDFVDGVPWTPTNGYSGQIVFNPVGVSSTGFPYPPMWKVFPAYPLLGNQVFPWNYPNTDIRKLWCWESTVGFPPQPVTGPGGEPCDEEVQNLASRLPWDVNPRTGTPTFTSSGNNAQSAEAWTSPFTPGPPSQRPVSLEREYVFPWTNAWHKNQPLATAPPGCSEANFTPAGNDILAAVTNLFAMHNRMHDWSYFLGFTERRWNAQEFNFGQPTLENDSLIGNAQAGAVDGGFPSYTGRDNANMIPLPDGVRPITNMYLWQPLAGAFYAPCVDGDYDMAVIGHEFGHLTENRMIGKGSTRGGHHAGAMGESFGDFSAAEYLNEYSYVPVSGENPFSVGAYVTGNKDRAIRNYNMSFPRTGAFPTPGVSLVRSPGPLVNPLNFSDHGYDGVTGAQVHADGEIWSATNFDIRQALVAKYNATYPAGNAALQRQCAEGERPPEACPGNRRWIQIVFDAMVLMPTAPSMLQARDAYFAADMMRFGGANQNELWLAFARRGFGKEATSSNGPSNENDADPKPDFQSARHANAIVRFRAVAANEGNAPVRARIFVGHYEARVSPIADTDPTTGPSDAGSQTAGASNLDNRAGFAPGTYEFVARADGYGHVRFRQTFTAGQSTTVTVAMPTNWASTFKGATATGDGTNHQHLIDDREATNWDEPAGGPPVNVQQPKVTVDLAGTAARKFNRVQVSTLATPGENRFVQLRQFRIETSTNGVTFTPWITSAGNAFPGFNPRPVAPEMILRSFSGPSRQATHVRIVVLHNQCTGNPDFQGEQDNDPLNPTDCRFGNPGSNVVPVFGDLPQVLAERQDEVHITELQVFSSTGGAGGGNGGGGNGDGGGDDGGDNECDENDDLVVLGPATAKAGDTVQYTITYTNLGITDDDDCEIDDLLGDDLAFVSATAGGVYNDATNTVTFRTGKVAAGGTYTATVTAKISSAAEAGARVTNEAYFSRLGLDVSPLGTWITVVAP